MKIKQLFLLINFALLSGNAFSAPLQWVSESGDSLTSVGGYDILEFKDADGSDNLIRYGNEWTVMGQEWFQGGSGSDELWLYDVPSDPSSCNSGSTFCNDSLSRAFTTLDTESSVVSFMLTGDANDGFAEFLVDDQSIGIFNLYNLGDQSLIVSGLDFTKHTLEIIQLGTVGVDFNLDQNSDDDVAIYGGAALDSASLAPVPVPPALFLFASGLVALQSRKILNRG